jgi:hypothetical protein
MYVQNNAISGFLVTQKIANQGEFCISAKKCTRHFSEVGTKRETSGAKFWR